MSATELLSDLRARGYTATLSDNRLRLRGPCRPPDELDQRIREYRDGLVRVLRQEEEPAGVIKNTVDVLEMARARFGPTRTFDPSEHPPTVKEMWMDRDKEAFFFPERYRGTS